MKYMSEEWVKAYCQALNNNPKYEKAATTWEGDFVFVAEGHPDEGDVRIYMDLWHGKCRKADRVDASKSAEFVIIGAYEEWIKVAKKELDPIQGMMVGKLKLEGDMTKIMRATKAAVELVNTITTMEGVEF
ncbi:MAG: SCP2 sterol-binding domain-containing protein [Candidatus Helarchaeota archaeon]